VKISSIVLAGLQQVDAADPAFIRIRLVGNSTADGRYQAYRWGGLSGASGGGMRTGSGSFTLTGVLGRRFFDPSVVRQEV
jgi:hypothetical protein